MSRSHVPGALPTQRSLAVACVALASSGAVSAHAQPAGPAQPTAPAQPAAPAQPTEPARPASPPTVDAWLPSARDASGRPCTPLGSHRQGTRTFIACGSAGLWEVQTDGSAPPALVRSHDAGGDVVGVFADPEGRVWVKIQSLEARPLPSLIKHDVATDRSVGTLPTGPNPPPTPPTAGASEGATGAATAPVAAPAAHEQPPRTGTPSGRVVEVEPGEVVISLGSAHGLVRGTRIELSVEEREALGGEQTTTSQRPIAVGEVTSVAPNHAKVALGMNERVPVGAVATPTGARRTRSLMAPPRMSGVWELEVMGRPFVALEELGGGVLLNVTFGRRFESNLRLFAALDPVGIADVETDDGASTASALAMVSYDAQYVEMGIGVGAQTVNDASFPLDPGSGIAVGQLARLGARDGLNLLARSTIVLFHREFEFGSLVVTGQIPVSDGYWLVLGGGGGVTGYAYGELGLRALVAGNGDRGSTFITATAGGAGIFESRGCRDTEFGVDCGGTRGYAGPMAGFGAEWRF